MAGIVKNDGILIMHNNQLEIFIQKIPKAELHVHIEGTLEPELMFRLAERNGIKLKYPSVDELRSAYKFHNLQSFLDVYYEGTKVLITEQDFYDLTWSYLKKRHLENILHAEIFFDPQIHTSRGVKFETIVNGITRALHKGEERFNLSSKLIMCFLRHLSEKSALKTLEESISCRDKIIGIGIDSAELGNPPSKFTEVFKRAISLGYLPVAHAGEEGPPEYIWEAIDKLKVLRVDHGVRCLEDKLLVKELIKRKIPLTICPLSNIKLGVFKSMKEHNLKKLLNEGLIITINSDDPAYFGGYINENFLEMALALDLSKEEIHIIAKNSFEASFLEQKQKNKMIDIFRAAI